MSVYLWPHPVTVLSEDKICSYRESLGNRGLDFVERRRLRGITLRIKSRWA